MNKWFKIALLIVLQVAGYRNCGFGQEQDAGIWLSARIEKKFSQSTALCLSQEVRIMNNASELSEVFTEIGFKYKFNKQFRIDIHYRYLHERKRSGDLMPAGRAYIDLSYRKKIKPAMIILRERVQAEQEPYNTTEEIVPQWHLRTKLILKPEKRRRITPYVAAELFQPLNDPLKCCIEKIRYSSGIEYEFLSGHTFDLGAMIQTWLNPIGKNDYIMNVGYCFIF